jgi:hypothetical protein
MIYRIIVGYLTRQIPLVEQKLLILPEHLSSPRVFSGVRVTRSLALCVCFVKRCLSFCLFFFWPLYCLFFDIRVLITLLVSSNSFLTNILKIIFGAVVVVGVVVVVVVVVGLTTYLSPLKYTIS